MKLDDKFIKKFKIWMEEMFTRYAWYGSDDLDQWWDTWHNSSPYNLYFQRFPLTEDMIVDFAKTIACVFLEHVSPSDIFPFMISNKAVLEDDEKSVFWLFPIAYANRTSIAYERGLALDRCGEKELALSVFEGAAKNGDKYCENWLKDNEENKTSFTERKLDRARSVLLPLPPIPDSFVVAKACIAWKEYPRAERILQRAADSGDVESAILLIRHKLIREAIGMEPASNSLIVAEACITWKEYPKAEKILQRAADAGNVECAMLLIRHKLIQEAIGMKNWREQDKLSRLMPVRQADDDIDF